MSDHRREHHRGPLGARLGVRDEPADDRIVGERQAEHAGQFGDVGSGCRADDGLHEFHDRGLAGKFAGAMR